MSAYTDGILAGQLGLTKVSPHVSPAFLAGYKAAKPKRYDDKQALTEWVADLIDLWPSREEADAIIAILENGEKK